MNTLYKELSAGTVIWHNAFKGTGGTYKIQPGLLFTYNDENKESKRVLGMYFKHFNLRIVSGTRDISIIRNPLFFRSGSSAYYSADYRNFMKIGECVFVACNVGDAKFQMRLRQLSNLFFTDRFDDYDRKKFMSMLLEK